MQIIKGEKATAPKPEKGKKNKAADVRQKNVEKRLDNPAKRPPPKQLPLDPSGSLD